MFCYPENISGQLTTLFRGLRAGKHLTELGLPAFATEAARFLATLNAIRCFRDGNGRSQLAYMTLLCDRAGHSIDFERFDPPLFLRAMIDSFNGDESSLVAFYRNTCA